MLFNKDRNVTRENNVIEILNCDHSKCASDFLQKIKEARGKGYEEIKIKSSAKSIYPNACVPMVGIIQHYISNGICFEFDLQKDSYLEGCGFEEPYNKSREEIKRESSPFDKVFKYETSGQVADLTQAYIDAISHQTVCEEGVLKGITWCINEVMDNVLVHSESSSGFVMAQYHPGSKHIAFCVYDSGRGIYSTLAKSEHKPRTELDSISMAMQEGVGDGKGQGNGLFGLYQIIHDNNGRLTITSGSSSIMMTEEGIMNKFTHIPFLSYDNKGTIIDFQLNLSKKIDIKKLFSSIGGFDGLNLRIDDMIDDSDCIHYDIFENCQGTATRDAGELLRNDIKNILIETKTSVILDFSKVKTVSSSFIDELVAKLFLDFGFVKFNSIIKLTGMNDDVAFLCERSLYMRIHKVWAEKQSKSI